MRAATSTRDLYSELARSLASGSRVGVCTVIETQGSTPQGPGAKMLVFEDGRVLGTVGGGCVEAEVRAKAREVLLHDQPGLFTFHLADDPEKEDGMVCGGSRKIFIGLWKP